MSHPYTYPATCIRCGSRFNPDLQVDDYFTPSGERLCSEECAKDEKAEREDE